jgi:SAM-dependent methyltransferase
MKFFEYEGYKFPVHLVDMTGGGTDTWDEISKYHVSMYKQYAPIQKDHFVVEMGSGVGRDAIQIAKILSKKGRYIGLDIIRDSILWCQQNISTKHPNFEFIYLDINSQIHNPTGGQKTTDIKLPIPSNSVDRIMLHSVFTHMFEDDITHYLKDFRRILKKDGIVLASFFLLDEETLARARKNKSTLTFKYPSPFGKDSLVNDNQYPEGAVGYYPAAIKRMLKNSRMKVSGPVHIGSWSGLKKASNGQDIFVLQPAQIIKKYAKPKLITSLD